MNKLKLLYDVTKAMQAKETFTGVLTAQVQKDQAKLFGIKNEFTKDLSTGRTKAKIATELDYQGKTVNHESNTEFAGFCHGEDRRHPFMTRLHHSACCGGLKEKFSRLACAFGILNALAVEEQENKAVVISLNSKDLPEDLKAHLSEKISQRHAGCGHGFMQEFCAVDKHNFLAEIFVNKNYEIEKILLTFDGSSTDGENTPHRLTASAEVTLTW
jgi:cyd operon protein YbgT